MATVKQILTILQFDRARCWPITAFNISKNAIGNVALTIVGVDKPPAIQVLFNNVDFGVLSKRQLGLIQRLVVVYANIGIEFQRLGNAVWTELRFVVMAASMKSKNSSLAPRDPGCLAERRFLLLILNRGGFGWLVDVVVIEGEKVDDQVTSRYLFLHRNEFLESRKGQTAR